METWKEFGKSCPDCGGETRVKTSADAGRVWDGDLWRCLSGHYGVAAVVGESGDTNLVKFRHGMSMKQRARYLTRQWREGEMTEDEIEEAFDLLSRFAEMS